MEKIKTLDDAIMELVAEVVPSEACGTHLDTPCDKVKALGMCLTHIRAIKRQHCRFCRYRHEEPHPVGAHVEISCKLTGNQERLLNSCQVFTDDPGAE